MSAGESLDEALARVLGEHRLRLLFGTCTGCDWRPSCPTTIGETFEQFAAHQAATLAPVVAEHVAGERAAALADLLGAPDDEPLIEVITDAIQDAQTDGRTEYKRRIGLRGRRTIAWTILW